MTITQIPISTLKNASNGIAGLNANAEYAGKIYKQCNVRNFGADPTGVADSLSAFNAAMDSLPDSGGVLIVDSVFYCSDTIVVNKPIAIIGTGSYAAASGIKFPGNKTGIRFNNSQLSGTGTSADGASVKNLSIRCINTQTSGHGIDVRASGVVVDGCFVTSFPEDGIHIFGDMGLSQGNGNLWRVTNTEMVSCNGNGLRVHGADANAGLALNVSVKDCGGWSFIDESKLGNTYVACHAAGSALGDYKNNGTTTYSTYLGCYSEVEAGVSQSSFTGPATIVGGIMSTQGGTGIYGGVGDYYGGLNLNSKESRIYFRLNGFAAAWLKEDRQLTIDDGGYRSQLSGGAYSSTRGVTTAKYSPSTDEIDAMQFDNLNGRAGRIAMYANSVVYATSSDYRLKEDIRPMVGALEKISLLNPVTFKWKTGGEGQGFIAHEIQRVFPEAVTGEKDGEAMQSVDSSFVVATLVKAVQELREEVRVLRCSCLSKPATSPPQPTASRVA